MVRWLYLALAWLFLALAALGVVLPGLPTTPFVLLAAWAAARGSPRLHAWLRAHRMFGPTLVAWETSRAVPRRAKRAAVVAMAVCAALTWAFAPKAWMAAVATVTMATVACWLWMRPEPPAEAPAPALPQADRGR